MSMPETVEAMVNDAPVLQATIALRKPDMQRLMALIHDAIVDCEDDGRGPNYDSGLLTVVMKALGAAKRHGG